MLLTGRLFERFQDLEHAAQGTQHLMAKARIVELQKFRFCFQMRNLTQLGHVSELEHVAVFELIDDLLDVELKALPLSAFVTLSVFGFINLFCWFLA